MVSPDTPSDSIPQRRLYQIIINGLREAPDGQISPDIREQMNKFDLEKQTDREAYDFLVGLSRQPITEISGFVREICSLDRHYQRPEN